MIKFLLITILLFYAIYKVGGFFFRTLFSGAYEHQRNYQQRQHRQQYNHNHSRTAPNSNVKVDYVPNSKSDRKEQKNFNGGQYVDYEEVK